MKFHQKHKIPVILDHQWKSVNFMLNQSEEIFQKLARFIEKIFYLKNRPGFTKLEFSHLHMKSYIYVFHQKHKIPVNLDHQWKSVNFKLNQIKEILIQKLVGFAQTFSYQKKRPNFIALGGHLWKVIFHQKHKITVIFVQKVGDEMHKKYPFWKKFDFKIP